MLHKLTDETKKDLELQLLYNVVMSGWPRTKEETQVESKPYWSYRDDITSYEGLIILLFPTACNPKSYSPFTWKQRSAERKPEQQCFGLVSVAKLTSRYPNAVPVNSISEAT